MALEGYKLIKEETLQDISDAIREKSGTTATILVEDFADSIRRITAASVDDTGGGDTGGGDSGGGEDDAPVVYHVRVEYELTLEDGHTTETVVKYNALAYDGDHFPVDAEYTRPEPPIQARFTRDDASITGFTVDGADISAVVTYSFAGYEHDDDAEIIHVGAHWVEEENVNDYIVTTTGELEAYEDSAGWEVDATGIGYGTVTVTRKLDGEVVRQTEYIIIA